MFAGKEFYDSYYSLMILCVSLAISLFGILYTNTILLPMQKEKEVTVIMIIAAFTNAALNIFMIPLLDHVGAAITTVIAEAIVMILQMIVVRKYKIIKLDKKTIAGTIAGCIWIASIVVLIRMWVSNMVVCIFISIIFSIIGYYGIHLAFKNRYLISILTKIKNHCSINR